LRLDGAGWLRPVSNKDVGQLYPEHYTMDNRKEIGLLDVAEIELARATPSLSQPENWLIKTSWFLRKRWRFVRKMGREEAKSFLLHMWSTGRTCSGGWETASPIALSTMTIQWNHLCVWSNLKPCAGVLPKTEEATGRLALSSCSVAPTTTSW
jgi:hypothetical protein